MILSYPLGSTDSGCHPDLDSSLLCRSGTGHELCSLSLSMSFPGYSWDIWEPDYYSYTQNHNNYLVTRCHHGARWPL